MENGESQIQQQNNSSRKKGKIIKIAAILLLLIIFLMLAGLFGIAASVFSERKTIPLKQLTKNDLVLQQKLIRRLSKEVLTSRPKKESTLVLKTSELESLFRLIDYGFAAAKLAGKYNGMAPRYFEPVFSNGKVQAVYPLDTGYSWLFGGVLRWHITATPEFSDKMLAVNIHDCRLGVLPLPSSLAENFLLKMLERLYKSQDYKLFCSMVKKIYLETDGSLVVIYHPARLMPLLMF